MTFYNMDKRNETSRGRRSLDAKLNDPLISSSGKINQILAAVSGSSSYANDFYMKSSFTPDYFQGNDSLLFSHDRKLNPLFLAPLSSSNNEHLSKSKPIGSQMSHLLSHPMLPPVPFPSSHSFFSTNLLDLPYLLPPPLLLPHPLFSSEHKMFTSPLTVKHDRPLSKNNDFQYEKFCASKMSSINNTKFENFNGERNLNLNINISSSLSANIIKQAQWDGDCCIENLNKSINISGSQPSLLSNYEASSIAYMFQGNNSTLLSSIKTPKIRDSNDLLRRIECSEPFHSNCNNLMLIDHKNSGSVMKKTVQPNLSKALSTGIDDHNVITISTDIVDYNVVTKSINTVDCNIMEIDHESDHIMIEEQNDPVYKIVLNEHENNEIQAVKEKPITANNYYHINGIIPDIPQLNDTEFAYGNAVQSGNAAISNDEIPTSQTVRTSVVINEAMSDIETIHSTAVINKLDLQTLCCLDEVCLHAKQLLQLRQNVLRVLSTFVPDLEYNGCVDLSTDVIDRMLYDVMFAGKVDTFLEPAEAL